MKKYYIRFGLCFCIFVLAIVSSPKLSSAQTPTYSMRNLTLDTLTKTIYLPDTAADRDGKLYEYSGGVAVKNWKVKYEQKGHMRAMCIPPILQLSFDKTDSKGNPKELFTGVSTYGSHTQLQYQNIRLIPDCDGWNDYFASMGDIGFNGQLDASLREYTVQAVLRKFQALDADVIGFANVSFVTPDAGYGGHTYRYMIIQRPKELDDQIPFTTQFNLNPVLYEAEGTNGWVADYNSIDRLRSAVMTNTNTQARTTIYFDQDSTIRFLLLTEFMNVMDMAALHNEDWGVDKTTGKVKIISHGFDASFSCYSPEPSWSSVQQMVQNLPLPDRAIYQAAFYRIAREIFLQPSSLATMQAVVNNFPYPNVDKSKLQEFIKLRFYQYSQYYNSRGFADLMGQTYAPVNIALPFASDTEYKSHLAAFQQVCSRQQLPLASTIQVRLVGTPTLTSSQAQFTVDVTAGDAPLQVFRMSSAFKVSLVGKQSGTSPYFWAQNVAQSGVDDFAGPYYVILPRTTARFLVTGTVNSYSLLKDTYYAHLDSFQPNNDVLPFTMDAKTDSLDLGSVDPMSITSPIASAVLSAGASSPISWTGNPGRSIYIMISDSNNARYYIDDPDVQPHIYAGNKFDWKVGSIYKYDSIFRKNVLAQLEPGQYSVSVQDGNSGIMSNSVSFNLVSDAPIINLSASPNPVAIGQPTTLSWSTKNATSCSSVNLPRGGYPSKPLNIAWGNPGLSGSVTFSMSGTTNLILGISCTGPKGTATNSLTIVVASIPSATITGTPTLALQYDPSGEESSLVSRFDVIVSAGSQDQKISKNYAFWSYASSTMKNISPINGNEQYSQPSGTVDDGNGFYLIPANTKATFTVQNTYNPRNMFAGSYKGIMVNVAVTSSEGANQLAISSPNTTNSVVIVGEVSPYIDSYDPNPATANATTTLHGVRFDTSADNTIILQSKGSANEAIKIYAKSQDGTTLRFVPNVPFGDFVVQVQHSKTGLSNAIYYRVSSAVSTYPILTLSSPDAASLGNPFTLSWISSGAVSCTLTSTGKGDMFSGYVGPIQTTGQIRINTVSKDDIDSLPTTLTVSCRGAGGTTTKNVRIEGYVAQTPPLIPTPPVSTSTPTAITPQLAQPVTPTITSLTINPSPVVRGQPVTLSWTTTGIQSCTIDSFSLSTMFNSELGVVRGPSGSITTTVPLVIGRNIAGISIPASVELGCYTGPNLTGTYIPKMLNFTIPAPIPTTSMLPTGRVSASIWEAIRNVLGWW